MTTQTFIAIAIMMHVVGLATGFALGYMSAENRERNEKNNQIQEN